MTTTSRNAESAVQVLAVAIAILVVGAALGCSSESGRAATEPATQAATDVAADGPLRSGAPTGSESPTTLAESRASRAEKARAEIVRTVRPHRGRVDAMITASGSITAPRLTELGPEVPGRLLAVSVDVGDALSRSDIVFRIDPTSYRIDLEEAKAELELARAEAAEAAQEVQRYRRLDLQKIVPEQELLRQETRFAVAEAKVAKQEARLHRAQGDLDRTVVRAPYDSSVVDRRLHEGAMVGTGSVVVTLQALSGFEAHLAVPEAAPAPVRVGDPVELIIEGIRRPLASKIVAVNARIDAASRTYQVRAPVEDEAGTIKAGSFVRAEIRPVADGESILVPRDAVLAQDGRNFVFRLDERLRGGTAGQTAEQVPVRLGAAGAEWVEVVDGVGEQDELIVGAIVDRLTDGAPVERRVVSEESE